jgi:hypothetical protein
MCIAEKQSTTFVSYLFIVEDIKSSKFGRTWSSFWLLLTLWSLQLFWFWQCFALPQWTPILKENAIKVTN